MDLKMKMLGYTNSSFATIGQIQRTASYINTIEPILSEHFQIIPEIKRNRQEVLRKSKIIKSRSSKITPMLKPSESELSQTLSIIPYKNKYAEIDQSQELRRTLQDINFLKQMSQTHTESMNFTPFEELSQIINVHEQGTSVQTPMSPKQPVKKILIKNKQKIQSRIKQSRNQTKLEIIGTGNGDYEVAPSTANFTKRSISQTEIRKIPLEMLAPKRPVIYLNISDNIQILKNGIQGKQMGLKVVAPKFQYNTAAAVDNDYSQTIQNIPIKVPKNTKSTSGLLLDRTSQSASRKSRPKTSLGFKKLSIKKLPVPETRPKDFTFFKPQRVLGCPNDQFSEIMPKNIMRQMHLQRITDFAKIPKRLSNIRSMVSDEKFNKQQKNINDALRKRSQKIKNDHQRLLMDFASDYGSKQRMSGLKSSVSPMKNIFLRKH